MSTSEFLAEQYAKRRQQIEEQARTGVTKHTSNPSFNKDTTGEEASAALSQYIQGKNVIITGCSPKGLGAETARHIARHKPNLLVLAGRGAAALEDTKKEILSETPDANIRILILDLADLNQVKKAAQEVLAYPEEKIDVLINNAAVMRSPYMTTAQGHEMQFGTNHLGHFAFTTAILPKILPNGRIVSVSSSGHAFGGVRFDDPDWKEPGSYDPWKGYGQAKTANMLFAVGLVEKYGKEGLTAFSVHPGGIATPLQRYTTQEDKDLWTKTLKAYNPDGSVNYESGMWKTLSAGTSTHIVAAFDPAIVPQNGSFLADCQIANEQAQPYALDKADALKLWDLSEKIISA